jgi:hypothetical protein
MHGDESLSHTPTHGVAHDRIAVQLKARILKLVARHHHWRGRRVDDGGWRLNVNIRRKDGSTPSPCCVAADQIIH